MTALGREWASSPRSAARTEAAERGGRLVAASVVQPCLNGGGLAGPSGIDC